MSQNDFDVIVVGAGIGGLFCANRLIDQGLKVLMIEQHRIPGGYCTSIRRKKFILDVGAHVLGTVGNSRTVIGKLIKEWGLDLEFLPLDDLEQFHFPEDSFVMPSKFNDLFGRLKELFPEEEENINRFSKELKRVVRNFLRSDRNNPVMEQYQDYTYQQFLDEYFQTEKISAYLSALWGFIGLPSNQVSLFAMAAMLCSYLVDGTYYVKGGVQKFSNALANRLKEKGGVIQYRTKVERIVIEDQVVQGVRTDKEEFIPCDTVIHNGNLNQVLEEDLPMNKVLKHVRTGGAIEPKQESLKLFSMYFGVNLPAEKLKALKGFHFTGYDMSRADAMKLYVVVPSLSNPSLAPDGSHVVIVNLPLVDTGNDMEYWDEEKSKQYEQKMLSMLESMCPGFQEGIVYQDSASPYTFYRYTLNSNGSLYGWSKTPEQMWVDNVTTIQGLYQTGHWSYPSCGIAAVAYSGIATAQQISSK